MIRRLSLPIRCTIAAIIFLSGTVFTAQVQEDPIQRGLTRGCLFSFYPSRSEVWVKCDFSRRTVRNPEVVKLGKEFTGVTVSVMKAGETKVIVEASQPLQDGMANEFCIKVPPLEGSYEIKFVFAGGKEPVAITRTFERKKFAWEGNKLGITDRIYPPFEPMSVTGEEVRVVQRRYKMNGLGLWDSVVSKEREILAGPMTIRYELADGQAC